MKTSPTGSQSKMGASTVQRIDVVVLLIIVILLMLVYQWFVVFHQLQHERQVNAALKQMKMELQGRLAVQQYKFNERVSLLEQVAVDKKFIQTWGEYFAQMDQYETRRARLRAVRASRKIAVGGANP